MTLVDELRTKLERHPSVLGLIAFGSSGDPALGGDVDLLAVLAEDLGGIRSLHFAWGPTPVDLNLRTLAALRPFESLPRFESMMLDGRLLFDRTGAVGELVASWRVWSDSTSRREISADQRARIRHWHGHVLEKIRGRSDSFARFLLGTHLGALVENYFRVRRLPYRGPKASWDWLSEHEPEMRDLLDAATAAPDLQTLIDVTERLTDLVLEPVGGPWRPGEILACGSDSLSDLATRGQTVYDALLGPEA